MHYLGIDYGGTKIKVGYFDENIKLLNEATYNTKDAISNKTINSIKSLILDKKVAIGLSIACFVDQNNKIVGTTNLNDDYLEFIRMLEDNISTNISILNDADAALRCELAQLDKPKTNVCMIVLGTGVGGSISLNNKMIQGNRGISSEIGHLKICNSYKFKCKCGRIDCLETLVSTQGFINLYEYYKESYPNSVLHDFDSINVNLIFDHSDDVFARYIIDKALYYLVQACIQVALICDIELFIIGGGISLLLEDEIEYINKLFKENAHYLQHETLFQIAANKNQAGIKGAVLYAKEEQVK
ncbi:MAG: ROK family protein [Erysipelotrichales bacterium]